MSLLNAGLAGFLALTLIPIIIYLINRQRYQRVRWAAMEFLLRAMRKNRRRLRFENLLLLILRTLIILLFVLGMLRPFLESNPLAAVGGRSRAELIVIDRSFSMGLKEGRQTTLLIQAIDEAKQRLSGLDKGDRLGLILGGGTPVRLLPEPSYVTGPDGSSDERVLGLLEGVELAYEPFEIAFTLEDAAQWIREKGGEGGWTIHLFTDLQRRDWTTDEASDSTIGAALRRLQEMEVPLVVHPMGTEKPRNASVVGLRCRDRILAVDLSTAFEVSVENRALESVENLEVELWVDDNVQGSRSVSLDPGGSKVVTFPYVFRDAGLVRVKAVLLSDALEQDNVYHAVLEVRESVQVLIVDGGYAEGADEAAWLEAAVSMGPAAETGIRMTPYDARVIAPERLDDVDLDDVDVLIFANVGRFGAGEAERVENFLRAGGGVLAFVGERMNIPHYVQEHYRGGEGWFPFLPRDIAGQQDRSKVFELQIVQTGHPVLSYLAEEETAGMGLVYVHRFVRAQGRLPEAAVLATLTDAVETPVLVEKAFGNGNALVVCFSPDRQMSNFPITPAYVVFLHESLPYLAARADQPRNLGIGQPFSRVISSEEYATRVLLINPDGSGVPVVLEEQEGGDSFLLQVDGQAKPGNFEIRFGGDGGDAPRRQEWFAVNADPREGILDRIPPEELKEAYPEPGEYLVIEEGREVDRSQSAVLPQRSGEIWRSLFWAVLIFLFMESLLARFFGRQRVRMST